MKQPKEAFEKAKDLLKMGIAKATNLEPLQTVKISVNPTALVVGGGVAGMSAALSLSKQGFKTYLIEKENKLGGRLNNLYKLFPYNLDASQVLNNKISEIQNAKNLTIYTSTIIKKVDGFIGNFEVEIEQDGKFINIIVGTIIIAVGSSLLNPHTLFAYDGKVRITQQELEIKLKNNDLNANNIVMIQCVGSRIEERQYCSSVCCMTALKNALIIKEMNPNANITILFRDLYTPGTIYEKYYRNAREKGILFVRYNVNRIPEVKEDQIIVFNENIGDDIILPYDLLVLSIPLIANSDNKELAQKLKVPLEINKFFLEAHVKLRPIDFATDGVYIAGSGKWPVDITESITQGYAAASRVSTILAHKGLEVEGATSCLPEWNKGLCKGCEVCINVCPYHAIKKNELDEIEIIQALCKGCGVCGATCSKKAITMNHFTNEQIMSEILALGGKEAI